jgi:predicted metal-dependent RNase
MLCNITTSAFVSQHTTPVMCENALMRCITMPVMAVALHLTGMLFVGPLLTYLQALAGLPAPCMLHTRLSRCIQGGEGLLR